MVNANLAQSYKTAEDKEKARLAFSARDLQAQYSQPVMMQAGGEWYAGMSPDPWATDYGEPVPLTPEQQAAYDRAHGAAAPLLDLVGRAEMSNRFDTQQEQTRFDDVAPISPQEIAQLYGINARNTVGRTITKPISFLDDYKDAVMNSASRMGAQAQGTGVGRSRAPELVGMQFPESPLDVGLTAAAAAGPAFRAARAVAPQVRTGAFELLEQAAAGIKAGEVGALKPGAFQGVDDLADWERSAKKLAEARAKGPKAFEAERARQAAITNERIAAEQAASKANAATRFGNTAKQAMESTREAMARAANAVRDEGGMAIAPDADPIVLSQGMDAFSRNVAAVPSALRRMQTQGDVAGARLRQALPVAAIDPKLWGRGTSRTIRAYFEDPQARGVMAEIEQLPHFAKDTIRMTADGEMVRIPAMSKVLGIGEDFQTPGFETINDSLVTKIAENSLPFSMGPRSEKAMRVGLIGDATELRNGMIESALKAGIRDDAWFDHYGDIAKAAVGYGDVPALLKGFSNGFYSLRNVIARFQTLTQPFTKPGPLLAIQDKAAKTQGVFSASPRGVAARHLTRFAAAELGNLRLLSAAGRHSGLFEVGWNPLEGGFGRLDYQDEEGNHFSTDLLGGYGSMIKALARSGAAANDAVNGRPMEFSPLVEWLNFARYKLGPVPAVLVDTAVANDPTFSKMEDLESPFATNLLDLKPADIGKVLPFFAGESVQALLDGTLDIHSTDDLFKSGANLLASWAGAPQSIFPASTSDKLTVQLQDIPLHLRTDSSGQVIDEWGKLTDAQKNTIKQQYPELAEIAAEQKDDRTESQRKTEEFKQRRSDAYATFQQTGDGAAYRAELSAIATESRGAYDVLFKDSKEFKEEGDRKLVSDFYDELDKAGNDFEQRDRLEAQFRASKSAEQNKVLDAALLTSSDPNYAKLKAARSYLETHYWDERDKAYETLVASAQPGSPATKYKTYDDLSEAANDRTNADFAITQRLKATVDSRLNDQTAKMRYDDPKTDALLYIYGYRDSVISVQSQAMVTAWAKENGVTLATPPIKRPE